MANESLVMTAEVRDSFSSTLRKLQSELRSLSTTGAASTKTLQKDWKGVGSEIQGAAGSITRDMLPAMRQGNLAGLALGGAIGGAALALKNFASETTSLNNFSKEIGLSGQELAKLKVQAGFFGQDWMNTQQGLRTFQDFMTRLKNDTGKTISDLRSTFGVAGDELARKLLNANSMKEATEIAFDAIKSTGSESKARAIAQAIFGNETWARIIRETTPALEAEFRKVGSKIEENKDAAERFNLALQSLKTVAENLRNESLGPLLKVSAELIDKWKEPIGGALKDFAGDVKAVADQFDRIGSFFSNPTWEGFLRLMDSRRGTPDDPNLKPPTTADTNRKLDSWLGPQSGGGAAAPGSPAKDIPKTNEELRQTNEKLKTATEKQTSSFDKFLAIIGQGGDTAGLGPGLGGVSAGGGGLGGAGALREFMGGGGGGGSIRRGAPTGGGGGRPVAGAATSTAMRAAMDQLRQEGVPEGNLRAAAAHLVGQAQMESGLDPTKTHDQGTGAGIYGARDDPKPGGDQRRSKMFSWLAANGYDRNSLEGQMKYMAHEAMTGSRFGPTRNVLMNANERTLAADTHTITRNFEAPQFINNRSGAVLGAYRALEPGAAPAALGDLRVKGGATGGGEAAGGVVSLAQWAQSNLPGFNRVTAMNDRFHRLRRGSAHNRGLATDFTIDDPRQSAAAAQQLREHIIAQGLDPSEFKVLDEYKKLSRGGTGGHLHAQFQSEESAARYRKSILLQQQQKAENAKESKLEANGTVNVHLHDSLREKSAKVDTEGMFRDVKVNRGRAMGTAEDYTPLNRAAAGF